MLEYWLWLAHRPNLNDHQKLQLVQSFQTPQGVYQAESGDFDAFPTITGQGKIALAEKDLSPYQKVLEYCQREQIRILTIFDPAYPRRLFNIYDPPPVLYYKGTLPQFDGVPVVSVVGTRRSTAYGQATAMRLGLEISQCGGMVVSGLAAGIDAAAMTGALQSGRPTVGVLGTGVDVVFPRENKALFWQVEQCGCLLSEFLPKTPGFKWNFPRRNRIISGLSVATVVVEAPERSGALNTARQALNQGRDVYVVPGNIDLPSFVGSNRLLSEGAGSVTSGWDVLREYQSLFPDKIRKAEPAKRAEVMLKAVSAASKMKQKPGKEPPVSKKDVDNKASAPYIDINISLPTLSAEEQKIVDALHGTPKGVDDIIAETGISSGALLGSLTMLELKKVIVRLPGNRIAPKG